MTRQELLKSPAYWEQQAQLEIYQHALEFMQTHRMNRTQFAEYLGVSKSYVTQLLSGDYNYSLEKLIDLSIKIGFVLQLEFKPITQVLFNDMTAQKVEPITGQVPPMKTYNFIYKLAA